MKTVIEYRGNGEFCIEGVKIANSELLPIVKGRLLQYLGKSISDGDPLCVGSMHDLPSGLSYEIKEEYCGGLRCPGNDGCWGGKCLFPNKICILQPIAPKEEKMYTREEVRAFLQEFDKWKCKKLSTPILVDEWFESNVK